MDTKLAAVVVPVSDVDRAKRFYDRLGFRMDVDYASGSDFRVVQLTPPGSACSIILGSGITSAAPGSLQHLHLVVSDLEAARAELVAHGVEVSVPYPGRSAPGQAGAGSEVPGTWRDCAGPFADFRDPDGNGWVLQQRGRDSHGPTAEVPRDVTPPDEPGR